MAAARSLFGLSLALILPLAACDCGNKTTHALATISVTPVALDFGSLAPGSRSTQALQIANAGSASLQIQSIEITQDTRAAFSLGVVPQQLAPGTATNVEVTYAAPATEGADGATLVITSDADNATTVLVSLVGRSLVAMDGGISADASATPDAGSDAGTNPEFDGGPDAATTAGPDAGPLDAGTVRLPEAWYPFEETSGTFVNDATGHGHNGVLEGSGTTIGVPGHIGLAYHFLGTDGRVHVPSASSLDQLTGGSIAAWVSLDTIANLTVHQFASRGTGNNDACALFHDSCGNLQIIYQYGSGTTNATSNCNYLSVNTWAHVASVNDGTTLTVYMNGNPIASASGGLLGSLTSDLYIGRREQGIFATQGIIDELKWWTVALTPQEVCTEAQRTWNGTSCQ